MSRIQELVIVTLLSVLFSQTTVAAEGLESLRFLAGGWATEGEVVEYWLPPLRGLMVGINRAPEGKGMPFFEYLRIEARGDGIVYIASPKGSGTTEFRLTEISPSRAIFENPEHDFPKKIIYTRSDDRLEVEVGAETDGEWRSFTLSWSRAHRDSASQRDEMR